MQPAACSWFRSRALYDAVRVYHGSEASEHKFVRAWPLLKGDRRKLHATLHTTIGRQNYLRWRGDKCHMCCSGEEVESDLACLFSSRPVLRSSVLLQRLQDVLYFLSLSSDLTSER